MRLGYNTNGLAHHDLIQAIHLLGEMGYQSVAFTVDHGALSPFDESHLEQRAQVKAALDALRMRSVIETGARYLLDPRIKHEPTLVTADVESRQRRIAFYKHTIELARYLRSDCVSLWSGVVRDDANEDALWQRLCDGLSEVCEYAAGQGVTVGFEPEPGMFIDTMNKFQSLINRLNHPALQLTLDVGHLHCRGETPVEDQIRRWGAHIVNVHIEDMRAGIHEHLMFGEGEMQFPPIIAALKEINYRGGVHVELSRHSHQGPVAAQQAWNFLNPLIMP
jgi:sugar phosphate isomerase/epimerase